MFSTEAAAYSSRAGHVRTARSRFSAVMIAVALTTAALGFSAAPALATSTDTLFVVASGGVTRGNCQSAASACTLAWALSQATSGSTYGGDNVVIALGSGIYTDSDYEITGGLLSQLTLESGSGSPDGTVLDGNGTTTPLTVDASYPVTVLGVTLEDGGGAGQAADLLDDGNANVALDDAVVNGGLTNPDNTGLVAATNGFLSVADTTIEGGGATMFGVEGSGGTVDVQSSTITGEDMGVAAAGAEPVTITDSTIYDNVFGVLSQSTGVVDVTDSTISDSGTVGVGIVGSGPVELGGDILANAGSADGDCVSISAEPQDLGYNVTDDITCGFGTADGSVVSTNGIGLFPLASNGGPTQTQQITSASAAYDIVPTSATNLCSADTYDQRGVLSLQPGAAGCDAGAYQVAQPKITTSSLPSAEVGQSYSESLAASGGVSPFSFSITAGALPAGLTLSSSGTISGTPTSASSSTFTVVVTDSYGFSSTTQLSLSVAAAPPATTSTPPVVTPPVVTPPVGTPAVVSPVGKIESTSIKLKGTSGKVELACAKATCAGKMEIVKTVHEKVKKGKKTVEETKTIMLASGSYRLASGKRGSFAIKLTTAGKDLHASAARPVHETVLLTVTGGRSERRTVKLT